MTAPVIRRAEDEYLYTAIVKDRLQPWCKDMEEWGQKVRDDIMALEDAVIDLGNNKPIGNRPFRRKQNRPDRYKQKNPGGDPGDPPKGPW